MRDERPPSSPGAGDPSGAQPVWDRPTNAWGNARNQNIPMAPGPDDTPTRISSTGYAGAPPATPPPPAKRGVSRRAVLIGAGAGALGLGAVGAGLGFALSHRNSAGELPNVFATDAGQINHLLRRAGFGPTPSDLAEYIDAGVSGAIDKLINYGSTPDGLDFLGGMKFDFTMPQDLIRWWLLRMTYSKRPLEEKMTLFWHGVLTSALSKVGGKNGYPYLIQQNNLLRAKAMGRFDDLIRGITTDPAMLYWLDGRTSTGQKPNENFSRELMELFTLGIGNYTQDDVHNGALALAGWTINRATGKGVLVPRNQYKGTVTYLGQTGNFGVDDVVRIVCAQPSTPRFIAWRMWSFFVYETDLNDSALQPMVDAYNSSNHSISAMVRAMFTSSAFTSDKAYRARVKSPIEFVVGAVRGLGLETDGKSLIGVTQTIGQVPFDPPDVSGWPGDKVSAGWLSTQAWMTRVNFINALVAFAAGTPNGKGAQQSSATSSAVQQTINSRQIGSAQDLANYYTAALLDGHLADDRRAVVFDALTKAPTGGATLTLHGGQKLPAAGVRQMLYLLMSGPEYQMN